MLIRENSLNHWLHHFYGFGTWEAPVWFVGYEEGGGDLPEEVAEKVDYLQKMHPAKEPHLCDIRALYKEVAYRTDGPRAEVYHTLHDYRFGQKAILHGIWKNLISFTHGFLNKPLPDLLTFQRKGFATTSEALISLYPLPSPHNHAWYYSWLDLPQKSFLKTRKSYEDHLYPSRIKTILDKMAQHKPRVVVMYGMNNINALKESITQEYPGKKFKMVKGVKLETPQYHLADVGGTIVLITTQIPALKHNRAESGFNWGKLGLALRDL